MSQSTHTTTSTVVQNATHLTELKELILSRIAGILEHEYNEPRHALTSDSLTAHLAFKADPHLNELRLALERIERNEYGHCIYCKQEIPVPVLREAPTAHFCDRCAAQLGTTHPHFVARPHP